MRKLIGKYYVPKGDIRRVNRTPKSSIDYGKYISKLTPKSLRKYLDKRQLDNYVPGSKGESIRDDQNYTRGGGKRKRRKTKRKPKKTRRTKRRSRRSRR